MAGAHVTTGRLGLVLLGSALAACAPDRAPTGVSESGRLSPRERPGFALAVEGGVENGGMEGASASGTYAGWPPYGWSLLSPTEQFGDKNPPCFWDLSGPPPEPVTGWCNAGTIRTAFGSVVAATLVVPTPGSDGGFIADPLRLPRPFAILATQDVARDATSTYAVVRSAVRRGESLQPITLPDASTGRWVMSFDWAFATTEIGTGPGGDDAAWVEFRAPGGTAVDVWRFTRNDLQPGGTGSTSMPTVACGSVALGGTSASYTCTGWQRFATEVSANPALAGQTGALTFNVAEATLPTSDVSGATSTPDTPSALLFDNFNLTRIVTSGAVGTPIAVSPEVLAATLLNGASFQWLTDQRFCTTADATAAATTMTCTEPGLYVIALRQANPNDTRYSYAALEVLRDAGTGIVNGAGWITSPANACATGMACAGQTGRAHLGLVARPGRGGVGVEGNTEFRLQGGGLTFSATAYSALTVGDGRAQYRGAGTLNGVSGYGFLVAVVDGDARTPREDDRFRIKIWRVADGVVVYDTQRDANGVSAPEFVDAARVLGGGNVGIHRAR